MRDFLQALSSSQPTPGGGSASAMVGATGASLVSMLMELSIGKAEGACKERFVAIAKEAVALRQDLLELVEADARSFERVMESFRLPKGTEAEKKERRQKIQAAYKEAANTPLIVMEKCLRVMELAVEGIKDGNPNAITDGGVAALSGWTGLKGAALNIEINLGSIKDEDFVNTLKGSIKEIISKGDDLLAQAERVLKEELRK